MKAWDCYKEFKRCYLSSIGLKKRMSHAHDRLLSSAPFGLFILYYYCHAFPRCSSKELKTSNSSLSSNTQ